MFAISYVNEDVEYLIPGSCTACLVALDKEEKTLYSANLGDSGFILIRQGEVVHRSAEQQHYFNTPFQLAVPPSVLEGVVLADRFIGFVCFLYILQIMSRYT